MRSTFVVLFASLLVSGNLGAQSLEESYAKLCSDPAKAKSEACRILAQSLVAKLQGQQTTSAIAVSNSQPDRATQALWRKRWGVMLDMVGKEMFVVAGPGQTPEMKLAFLEGRSKMEWKIPGEEVVGSVTYAGSWIVTGTTRWDEPSQQLISTLPPPTNLVSYAVAQADGTVQALETTYAGMTSRGVTKQISPGRYENIAEKKEGGVWVEVSRTQTVEYSPERLAHERQLVQLEQQQLKQQLAQQQQDARDEKRAKSQQRAAMFNSVVQGVAQGLSEVDSGGYAESQANLDATVANIQNAAAVERQQQAQARAAQDRQGRYNEEQVLAANAEAAAERSRQAKLDSRMSNPARSNSNLDAQPRPISTAATQQESRCSEAPGFRKIFGYAEKTRELAMRSMTETPHLEPLQDVSCTQPPNLGYTLEGWWKCTAMAPTGLMVKHCPQSNSGVSSQ